MALISLNIEIVKYSSTVTMQVGELGIQYFSDGTGSGQYHTLIHYQFDGSTLVCDIHQYLCERLPYIDQRQCKQKHTELWYYSIMACSYICTSNSYYVYHVSDQ